MKPKLILSLPNSGSDWFARTLARVTGWKYYDKEFFNPMCNPQYRPLLERAFGCELVSCYRNIAMNTDQEAQFAFERTWMNENYELNKENFSLLKVPFFARHFDCVLLHRRADTVFPPKRLRVWQWYDAIWCSLSESFVFQGRAKSLEGRAHEAHQIMWKRGLEYAKDLNIPVISQDLLSTAPLPSVENELAHIESWGVNIGDLANEIVVTRVAKEATPIK